MRVYKTPSGYRAMTRVRDFDGKVRQVERYGRTQGAARAALSLALRERARVDAEADITPDTKLATLAEAWLDDFERQDRSAQPDGSGTRGASTGPITPATTASPVRRARRFCQHAPPGARRQP